MSKERKCLVCESEVITEDNLILDDVDTEEESITIDTYSLFFCDKEIVMTRYRKFNNNLGEMEESFEFETNLSLTDEDKDIIINFCLEQTNN